MAYRYRTIYKKGLKSLQNKEKGRIYHRAVELIGMFNTSRVDRLGSGAEQNFYEILCSEKWKFKVRIDRQVAVASLIDRDPGPDVSENERRDFYCHFTCRTVDFVISDVNDPTRLGVVEICDRSHWERKRQERDFWLGALFSELEIPFFFLFADKFTKDQSSVIKMMHEALGF